ncbi:MAG: hypothetical protein ACPH9N_09155 [Alteromonas sp.]
MTTRPTLALPAQLKKALEQHRLQADIADDDELKSLIGKLDALNDKVSYYKAKLQKK